MKKTTVTRLLALALSAGITFSGMPAHAAPHTFRNEAEPGLSLIASEEESMDADTPELYAGNDVSGFVERLYTIVLGRKSDPAGKKAWIEALNSRRKTGAEVAAGFFFSEEYKQKKKSDDAYVDDLYRTMLNRPGDRSGTKAWTAQLDNGVSRNGVYAGFVYSQEFAGICSDYGIERGDYSAIEERDRNPQVTAFIQRLYRNVLNRDGEADGLNAWAKVLNNQEESGAAVAAGFILSPEYRSKTIMVSDYIEMMYQTLLNRKSDPVGKRNWENSLISGLFLPCELIGGFAGSEEFQELCLEYNIISGAGENFKGDFPNMIFQFSPCEHKLIYHSNRIEPDCARSGQQLMLCTICGDYILQILPPTGKHTYGSGNVTKKASCEEDGIRTFTCTVCGNKKTEEIPAAGHSFGEPTVTNPSCEKEGRKVSTCTVCGKEEIEILPPIGNHTYGTPEVSTPTCTKEGKKVFTCSVCGDKKEEILPAIGHSYTESVIEEPTCGKEGKKALICSACGDRKEEAIPPTGAHTYGEAKVTEPTCTREGSRVSICSSCGYVHTETIEKLDHELQHEYTKMILADEDLGRWESRVVSAYHGYYQESVTFCNVCNKEFTGDNQIEEALSHAAFECRGGYYTTIRYDKTKWMDREEYTIMTWMESLIGGQVEDVKITTCKNCDTVHETRIVYIDSGFNPPRVTWEAEKAVESFRDTLVPRPEKETYIIGDPTVHVRDLE